MIPRHAVSRWLIACVIPLALGSTGCPDDPLKAETWIDKLDSRDTNEVKQAIVQLERLEDPKAIEPLGKLWRKQGFPQAVLKVMIGIAGKTTEKYGGPHWDKALPFLIEALDDFDVGSPGSRANAIAAATALGEAGDKEGLQPLIRAVNKSMPKLSEGQNVRVAAIRALGEFKDEPRAVDTLLKVLATDPKDQAVQLFGAAANALAQARSPKATVPLLETMYTQAALYNQCRLALIAIGKPAIKELIKVFNGEHKELNAVAKQYKFNIDCDKDMGPGTSCIAPTNLQYKAALLLGDMNAKEAVPTLTAALKKEPKPSFFIEDAPGPPQHNAILDALKRIADPSAADEVLAYWRNPNTEDFIRPVAIDTYSYLTTDTKALADLGKFIKDDGADEQVRMASGLAYGRLVKSSKDFEPLQYMINRYAKQVGEWEAKEKAAKKEMDAAQKSFDGAKAAHEKNKNSKKLTEAMNKAKGALDVKTRDHAIAENRVGGYREFQRTFEQNLVRGQMGVECGADPKCYIRILEWDISIPRKKKDAKADAKAEPAKEEGDKQVKKKDKDKAQLDFEAKLNKNLASVIKFDDSWADQEITNLKVAAVERAMIELIKMGKKASPVFNTILERVESTDRITRQGALMVLMQSAPLPCNTCIERLDEVIEDQKDQSTLAALTTETKAARNYFYWAGK